MRRSESYRWDVLATYNAERARGLVHTLDWMAFMATEQAEFDAEQRGRLVAEAGAKGHVVLYVSGGMVSGPADVVGRIAEAVERDETRSEGP